MATTQLTLSNDGLIAEFFGPDKFKEFFEKRLEVPADYFGLLMRNGQFVEAYRGAHFSVGGVFNQLKGIIGGSQSVSVLLGDLKTFQVKSDFSAITKDKVQVTGVVAIDLQINPEKPQNILGLMSNRKALSKEDIARRIRDTLTDRVFEASISRMNANEVRGNRGLQDLIQADTMKEIERTLGDLGILIRHTSVEWAINDVEKAEMARATAVRAADAAEFQYAQLKRESEREHESTILKLSSAQDIEKLKLQNETDLQRLVMSQELAFVDARETGKRLQEMSVLQHEMELLSKERAFKNEAELTAASHAGIDMQKIEARRQEIQQEIELLKAKHTIELQRMQLKFDHERRAAELKIVADEQKAGHDNTKATADTTAYVQAQQLKTQITADKAALEKLEGLQGLQAQQDRARLEEKIRLGEMGHKQAMDLAKLEAEREAKRLELGRHMTPEQTLAVNAGLSPQVAKILEEQAKAGAAANNSGNAQAMDIMKQMVAMADRNTTNTAEQAKALAQMIVQSSVGVAAGVGAAKAAGAVSGGVLGADNTVDCPKCGRTNEAKDRFCTGCGEQLRK
jgi:hypothetical protein